MKRTLLSYLEVAADEENVDVVPALDFAGFGHGAVDCSKGSMALRFVLATGNMHLTSLDNVHSLQWLPLLRSQCAEVALAEVPSSQCTLPGDNRISQVRFHIFPTPTF